MSLRLTDEPPKQTANLRHMDTKTYKNRHNLQAKDCFQPNNKVESLLC